MNSLFLYYVSINSFAPTTKTFATSRRQERHNLMPQPLPSCCYFKQFEGRGWHARLGMPVGIVHPIDVNIPL